MATDKKILTTKLDEDNEDRRKEISALKANIQKERDELRGQVCSNSQKEIQADHQNSGFCLHLDCKDLWPRYTMKTKLPRIQLNYDHINPLL